MFIRVINDWHLRGVNPHGSFQDLCNAIDYSLYPVVLNGDIFDFANCPYADLPKLYQEALIALDKLKKKNGYWILGNHECNALQGVDELLIGHFILATHGDIPMWGKDRSDKFRKQKRGAGWFKRHIVSEVIDELRRFWTVRPNDRLVQWVKDAKLRYPELKYVILGHSHPPSTVQFLESGVVGMILPRGVNDLNLVV